MSKYLKEIIIFALVSISALFILGYSVHMFIGGLVNPKTEFWAITITGILGVLIIAYMAWDIIKTRRRHH